MQVIEISLQRKECRSIRGHYRQVSHLEVIAKYRSSRCHNKGAQINQRSLDTGESSATCSQIQVSQILLQASIGQLEVIIGVCRSIRGHSKHGYHVRVLCIEGGHPRRCGEVKQRSLLQMHMEVYSKLMRLEQCLMSLAILLSEKMSQLIELRE